MVVTFCILWRHQHAKLAGFSAFLPTFLLAGFTDALPEIFRVPVSRVFFVLVLLSLLTLLAGIAFNRMGLEDFEVDLSLRTVKVSSVAAGVLTSLLPFAARNLGMIFLQPGVMPVLQSAVASVKLSSRALLVAKAKHTFAVLQVAHANKAMAKAERSISYRSSTRFSIRGSSMARDRADVSDHAAHLEGVLCAEDEEPQEPLDARAAAGAAARVAAFDMPVPAISEVPLETLGEILVKILRAMESEFSSIQTTLSSIPGVECRRFRHVAARIRRCGDLSVMLAVSGMDIVTLTNFAVEEAHLRRCLVASRKPVEVKTVNTLLPAVARVFLKSKLVQALSNVVWAAATIPAFLVMYDVRPDYHWWLTSLCVFSLPGVAFVSSCLNRKVLAKLLTTFQPTSSPPFQPVYILFWIVIMFGTFAALWRKHPAKIVSLALWLPAVMMATLVDAYPEAGRTLTSR
jgi:hypothetical protein